MILQLPFLKAVIILKTKRSYDDYVYREFQKTERFIDIHHAKEELMCSLIEVIGAFEQISSDYYLFENKEGARRGNIYVMPSTSFYLRSSISRAKRIIKKYGRNV